MLTVEKYKGPLTQIWCVTCQTKRPAVGAVQVPSTRCVNLHCATCAPGLQALQGQQSAAVSSGRSHIDSTRPLDDVRVDLLAALPGLLQRRCRALIVGARDPDNLLQVLVHKAGLLALDTLPFGADRVANRRLEAALENLIKTGRQRWCTGPKVRCSFRASRYCGYRV